MMRKVLIGLAAVALATGVSTLNASAHHGGGGGGSAMSMHGGGGGPHVSKGGGLAGPGHLREPRAYGFHRERFGYKERYRHRPYYRYGYRPYSYGGGYGGSCWSRVWIPDGWRRQWVCGYGRPSYGYRGYYHRPFYGHRYDHYRPSYGHR